MWDGKKQDLYERSTIRDTKIKISTTNPELKDKIHYNIAKTDEKVDWYIKFNIALDAQSVDKKTMNITETNGYILDAVIRYDPSKNRIILSPVDIYLQNEYYLLNISTKVRSAKGQNLKKEIHIMFKLLDNQIKEFRLLESTVKIAKPRRRTRRYQKELAHKIAVSKVYAMDQTVFEKKPRDRLPYGGVRINVFVALLGLVITGVGVWMAHLAMIRAGLAVSMAGAAHIAAQLAQKGRRSALCYNAGVLCFNFGRYALAQSLFTVALRLEEANEMAEYALNKTRFYE